MIRRTGVVFSLPEQPANDAAAYLHTGERSQLSPTGGLNDSFKEKTDTKTDDGSPKNTARQEVDALMHPSNPKKVRVSASWSPILLSTPKWSKAWQNPGSHKPPKLNSPNTVSCNDDFESKLCGVRLYQSHLKNPIEARSASVDEINPVRFQSACITANSSFNHFNPTLCETFPAFSEPFRSVLTATPADISQNKFSENEKDLMMICIDPDMQSYFTVLFYGTMNDHSNIDMNKPFMEIIPDRRCAGNGSDGCSIDQNKTFMELTPDRMRCAGTGIDGGSVDINKSFMKRTPDRIKSTGTGFHGSSIDLNKTFMELTPDRMRYAGTSFDGGSLDMNKSYMELTPEIMRYAGTSFDGGFLDMNESLLELTPDRIKSTGTGFHGSSIDLNKTFMELTPDRMRWAGAGIDGGSVDMNKSFMKRTPEPDRIKSTGTGFHGSSMMFYDSDVKK